ncbi:NAD(P)-binding protein [Phanerochaete sordida]|uniref:NAD(P)-binding protein n=1 Tax=Phanerochaete sordida TaxID=48140 RepID=A0A9P3LF48_9APHY|nr:NAD(P)-binding protein [Phanerochaete sordida]
MCRQALDKGDKVVATLRRPKGISDFASKYSSAPLLALKLDVTRPDSEVSSASREAKARFVRVDVVFKNAACFLVGEIKGIPEDAARHVMEVVF